MNVLTYNIAATAYAPMMLFLFISGFVAGLLAIWIYSILRGARESIKPLHEDLLPQKKINDKHETHESDPILKLERAKETAIKAELGSEAKSRFIARMIHEIRSSLNIIMGMTQLINDEKENCGHKQGEYLGSISDASKKLLSLTEEIAEFTTQEKSGIFVNQRSTPFDLDRLCLEIINDERPAAENKRISLQYSLDSTVPKSVFGDSVRLSQMISTLTNYAMRFTKQGFVRLKVKNLSAAGANPADIEFRIEDSDGGIPPEELENVFDFTEEEVETARKSGNIKLGLAMCQFLAKSMQGSMKLESSLNEGSVFIVKIPLTVKDSPAHEKTEKKQAGISPAPNLTGMKALLAEDDPVNRQLEKIFLQKAGFSVDTALNGEEAVEKFKINNYDIIFMDCEMPVMNGFTATKTIRQLEKNGRRTPIIAMTAYALSGDRDMCIESGMDDYVSKPINVKELIEISSKNIGKAKNENICT